MIDYSLLVFVIITVILLALYGIKTFLGLNIPQQTPLMQKINQKPRPFESVNVQNPFFISVRNCSRTSNKDAVQLIIKTNKACILKSFWYVNVDEVLEELPKSGTDKVGNLNLLSGCLLKNCYSNGEPQLLNQIEEDISLCITKPVESDDHCHIVDQRTDGDLKCTLIVTLELPGLSEEDVILKEDIVCLLTVIEPKCGVADYWNIERQIIQTFNNKIFTLKNLYASGVPDFEADSRVSNHDDNQLCIICHSSPVTRALLPCRHKCICGACYPRTKLCPICRKVITSYLITNDESNLSPHFPTEEEIQEQTQQGLNNMGIVELIRAIWNAS